MQCYSVPTVLLYGNSKSLFTQWKIMLYTNCRHSLFMVCARVWGSGGRGIKYNINNTDMHIYSTGCGKHKAYNIKTLSPFICNSYYII